MCNQDNKYIYCIHSDCCKDNIVRINCLLIIQILITSLLLNEYLLLIKLIVKFNFLCIHLNIDLFLDIGVPEEINKKLLSGSIYIERLEHLNTICSNSNHSLLNNLWENRDILDHIVVDSKHQLLYCYVPKVRNWSNLNDLLFSN